MISFQSNATWIDLVIVLGYLALIVLIGLYFSRRQKNLEEYFLAGRNMNWLPVGLSLMGAIHSGIQYIQGPSAAIKYGIVFLMGSVSWLIVFPWVLLVILPFYRKLGTFTCYEYLERRFGVGVRALGAFIFLMWRVGWIGSALYVPALAAYAVSGGRIPLTPMILLLGAVVTVSTVMGGMRAVIWTDVMQFGIMIGGLGLTVAMVIWCVPGHLSTIFSTAHAAGKIRPFAPIPSEFTHSTADELKFLFTASISFIGIPLNHTVGRLANYSTDQVMVQRFQTTRTLADSKRALLINSISDIIWTIVLAFVGISLFTYFKIVTPLPESIAGKKSDLIFPYFMAHVFPTGVVGIVIATVFAASLATIGSAINSCTSVAIMDLWRRIRPGRQELAQSKSKEENKSLTASRWLTAVFGVIGTIVGTQLSRFGDLIEITNKAIQTFTGPLLGLYLLGMFTRRSHQTGVLIGGALGTLVSVYLAFDTTIGFIWPPVYGLTITLISGYLFSAITPWLRPATHNELTWRRVMRGEVEIQIEPVEPEMGFNINAVPASK